MVLPLLRKCFVWLTRDIDLPLLRIFQVVLDMNEYHGFFAEEIAKFLRPLNNRDRIGMP